MFVGSQFFHANWNIPQRRMVRGLSGGKMQASLSTGASAPGARCRHKLMPQGVAQNSLRTLSVGAMQARLMSSAPVLGRRGEDSQPRIGVTPVRALPRGTMQAKLMAEAHKHMPQGVAENYRYWGDTSTVFVSKSKGCVLTDVDGKDFTDFRLGYGPIILGYCDERVDRAVCEEISKRGVLSGFSSGLDAEVIKQIKRMCPQIEKMRFANSGTEAVMGAVRTARGFTGRTKVAFVEGGFHGLQDEMMWKVNLEGWNMQSDSNPEVIPFGAGQRPNTAVCCNPTGLQLLSLNDFEMLEQYFKKHGNMTAAVMIEPIIGNAGSIEATKEWLQRLRDLCTKHGALLIFDEVKSGFRVAKGGAQELYGVYADLTTYAKAMGNGYPVACFGGRKDVMDVIGSFKGGVVHGGTFTANMIAISAAHATLEILENTNALATVNQAGADIMKVLGRVFAAHNIEHTFSGPPAMFGIHFTKDIPTNYRDWRKEDYALYGKFAWNLIKYGVMLEPDSREPWFICEAHKTTDLKWLENVAMRAMTEACAEHAAGQ